MLDNYVRDFKALIDWIQLQEKLEKTDAQNRWASSLVLDVFFSLPPWIAPQGETGSAGFWLWVTNRIDT